MLARCFGVFRKCSLPMGLANENPQIHLMPVQFTSELRTHVYRRTARMFETNRMGLHPGPGNGNENNRKSVREMILTKSKYQC